MPKSFFVPDIVLVNDCEDCGGIITGNTCELCVEDGLSLDVSNKSMALIMDGVFNAKDAPGEGSLNPLAIKKLVSEADVSSLAFDAVYEEIVDHGLTIIDCGRDEETIQGYLDTLDKISDLAISRDQPVFYGDNPCS